MILWTLEVLSSLCLLGTIFRALVDWILSQMLTVWSLVFLSFQNFYYGKIFMSSEFPSPYSRVYMSVVSSFNFQFGVIPSSVVGEIGFNLLCIFPLVHCLDRMAVPSAGWFSFFPAISLLFEEYVDVHEVHRFLDAIWLSWDVVPSGVTLMQPSFFVIDDKCSFSRCGSCFLSVTDYGSVLSVVLWWRWIHSLAS